jgi:hypothetical protein
MKLKTSTKKKQQRNLKGFFKIILFYFPKTTRPTPSSRTYTWQGGGGEGWSTSPQQTSSNKAR